MSPLLIQIFTALGTLLLGYLSRHWNVLRVHDDSPPAKPLLINGSGATLPVLEKMILDGLTNLQNGKTGGAMDEILRELLQMAPTLLAHKILGDIAKDPSTRPV